MVRVAIALVPLMSATGVHGIVRQMEAASYENLGNWRNASSQVEALICKTMQGTNETSVAQRACDGFPSLRKNVCKSGVDKVWHMMEHRCDSHLQQHRLTASVGGFVCQAMENKDYEKKGKDLMCAQVPESMQEGCEQVVGKLWDMALTKWCHPTESTTLPALTTAVGNATTFDTTLPRVPTSAPIGNLTTAPSTTLDTTPPMVTTSGPFGNLTTAPSTFYTATGNRTMATTSVPILEASLESSGNSSHIEVWVCKMMQGTNESSVVHHVCDSFSASQQDACESGVAKVWHMMENRCDSRLQHHMLTGSVNDVVCKAMESKGNEKKGKDLICARVPESMQEGCEQVVDRLWDMALTKWCHPTESTTTTTMGNATTMDTTSAAQMTTTFSRSSFVPTSLPLTTAPLGNLTTMPMTNETTSFPFLPTGEPMINTTSLNLLVV
jgi:hypothetical protein